MGAFRIVSKLPIASPRLRRRGGTADRADGEICCTFGTMNSPVHRPPDALGATHARAEPTRVSSYVVMGALVGAVPVPFLPGSLTGRVRGALLYDIASRHGLSITPDARRALSAPGLAEGPQGLLGAAVRFATTRVLSRLGPLTLLPPVRSALFTFALGHLFARYLEVTRDSRAVRVDEPEARRVRRAIDRAILGALSTPARPEDRTEAAPEELRDQITQATDGLLIIAAGLPAWLLRRLEAAFDAALAEAAGGVGA